MDDVVNRFARELADAIAAAVAEDAQVEACREKARAAGFEMKVTLEAVVGFVNRTTAGSAGEADGAPAGRCRAADRRPFEMTRQRSPLPPLAADCRGRNAGRRSRITHQLDSRNESKRPVASNAGLFLFAGAALLRDARGGLLRRPRDRRGSSGAAASGRRPARRPAGCRSGCSARRCPASEMSSRYFTSARRLLPCAAISTRLPLRIAGAIVSCQYGRKRATVSFSDSVSGSSLRRRGRRSADRATGGAGRRASAAAAGCRSCGARS